MGSDQGRDNKGQSADKKLTAVEQGDSGSHREMARNQVSISEQAFVDRIKRSDRWMIFVTAAIALSGVASAVILGKQFRAMNGQLEVMRGQLAEMKAAGDQTERAIAATNRLADQAAISATESRRLADQAEQSASATRQLAQAANESAAQSRRLADAAIKSAEAAARATEMTRKLARAATDANKISQEALVDVQRAFMFPKGIDFAKVPNVGMARATGDITGSLPILWAAHVRWTNSGNTPTKDFVTTTNCLISMKGQVDDPYTVTASDISKGLIFATNKIGFVFGPKQETDAGFCLVDPFSIIINSLVGINFYVYGSATYKDVLDPAVIHITEFCFIMVISGNPETGYMTNPPGIDPLHATTGYCRKHNCADDECKGQGL